MPPYTKTNQQRGSPSPLDGELTSSFMAKKRVALVDRQKTKVDAPVEAFTFTPSFTEGGGVGVGGAFTPPTTTAASRSVVPDNFDMTMNTKPGTAGSYFKTGATATGGGRPSSSKVRHGVTVAEEVEVVESPPLASYHQQSTRGYQKSNRGFAVSGRLPPLDRQAELEEGARQRALQAMAEQEEEDRLKHQACQIQRQVERLKLQQRIKARIEKQLLSSQRPLDKSVAAMGIDVDAILSRPKEATFASQHRAELKDEPNAAFIHYNQSRMQHNAAHRQYCMHTLQERQRMRMALERHCHAYYPRQKEKQLQAIGADTTGACRFPTVAELHAQEQAAHNHTKHVAEEGHIIEGQTKEVASRDDAIWEERCERFDRKQKTERVRELPFDVNRPYVKRANVKPSHFPAQVRPSGNQ